MNRIITTESFNVSPSANATLTAKLPVGRRYHQLLLNADYTTALGVTAKATIANFVSCIREIRLVVDGKVFRYIKPKHLFYNLALNGHVFNAGMMPIHFSEPWRETIGDQDFLAWGMGDVSNFEVQVDLLNYPGSIAIRLQSVADKAIDPATGTAPFFKEIIRQSYLNYGVTHVSGDGVLKITDLPKLDIYTRLHFFPTTSDVFVKDVEISVDGEVVRRAKMEELNEILTNYGFSATAANAVLATGGQSLVFDDTQRIADSLMMVNPMTGDRVRRFELTLNVTNNGATAQQIDLLMETFGNR